MAKFITLTHHVDGKVRFNLNYITMYEKKNDASIVYVTDGSFITKETPEEIDQIIAEAQSK